MKKLLLIAVLLLALVFTVVACTETPDEPDTSADDVATETPTEAPTDEPEDPTEAPTDEPDDSTEAPTDEPDDSTEAPTEEPTEAITDPADPVWIMDADGLAAMTNANAATVEKNEAGYASFTATGGDPWFLVCGNIGAMPEYLAIRYRTNTTQSGEIFIGSGAGPAAGASFTFNYNADSEWNLMVIHLPSVVTSITDGVIGHIRFDFYTEGDKGEFLDVEYMAFFNTAEYAQAYDRELHKAPVWNTEAGNGVVTFLGFNELNLFSEGVQIGGMFQGNGADWDKYGEIDFTVDTLRYWGWAGMKGEMGEFGYAINGGEAVFSPDFVSETEQPVIDMILPSGADLATRMGIAIPVGNLNGEFTVTTYYKDNTGFVVELTMFTVKRSIPNWETDDAKNTVTLLGFNELNPFSDGNQMGALFEGNGADWDKYGKIDFTVDTLRYWGWIGAKGELGELGYSIDYGKLVFSPDFFYETEQGVVDMILPSGADVASRVAIMIPVEGLVGEHAITVVYKSAAGDIVELSTFTISRDIKNWETDDAKNTVTLLGFNELNTFTDGHQGSGLFEGNGADWNKYGEIDATVDTLRFWGWFGVKGELGELGYSIDYGKCVFSPDFFYETEQGVIDMILPSGADVASRVAIMIPVEGLVGEHAITVVYKSAAGEIVELTTFTIVVNEVPAETPEA